MFVVSWSCLLVLVLASGTVRAQYGYAESMGSYGMTGGSGSAVPCSGECVGTYDKCAGKNVASQLRCCADEDQCVFKNTFYSQCRPIDKGVPMSWPNGMVLEDCTASDVCDDEGAISFKYETGELLFTTVDPLAVIRTGFSSGGIQEEECRTECVALEDCVMYEYRPSYVFVTGTFILAVCTLYDESVLPSNTRARPRDAGVNGTPAFTVTGVRCYYPPAVCGPLELLDPAGEYFMAENDALRQTNIQVGPERMGSIFTECANLCALGFTEDEVEGGDAGVCSGFAIDGGLCTLLYPELEGATVPYLAGDQAEVYSIEGC